MANSIERRCFERINKTFAGTYAAEDEGEGQFSCVNISGEGAMVSADRQLPEKKTLQLQLVSAQAKNPVQLTAQIVWQKQAHTGKWHAGLRFEPSRLLSLWPFIEKPAVEE